MQPLLLQLPSAGLPQQAPTLPDLPPGPSLDNIRGPIEIPFLDTWQIVLITTLATLFIGLLGWKLFRHIRDRKARTLSLTPYSAAIAELEAAAKLTADNSEQFAVLSSLAVRRYFETGKGIDALEQTTDEFLISLSNDSTLSADALRALAECLHHFDQVKFAKAALSKEERHQLTESALTVVRKCEQNHPANSTNDAQL